MNSPYGNKPAILTDLIEVADLEFLLKPLKMRKYKRISFDDNVYITDTISREEINEQNLKDDIWWNAKDYEKFNEESIQDVFNFMLKFPGLDFYSARKLLYNNHFLDIMDTINE